MELSSNVNWSIAFSVALTSLSPFFIHFSNELPVAIAEFAGMVVTVQLLFLVLFARINAKER